MSDEKKSTHRVEVVPVVLEKHPNADSLSIVRVFGYQVIVKSSDWEGIKLAGYIQPDSLVPDKPEYAFLNPKGPLRDSDRRIRVRRFRKELSQGLLVQAPEGSKIGDDVSEILGIMRYEPPEPGHSSKTGRTRASRGPTLAIPKYDVENWYRYGRETFTDGEPVFLTEKVHGCSSKFVFSSRDNKFFVGSRNQWLQEFYEIPPKTRIGKLLRFLRLRKPEMIRCNSVWWKIVDNYPAIENWCRDNPDTVIFGEIYGDVQDLKYGHKSGEVSFAAFEVFHPLLGAGYHTRSLAYDGIPVVPLVAEGAYSDSFVRKYIDGISMIPGANHCREGIVIHGRNKKLKAVSDAYLERVK